MDQAASAIFGCNLENICLKRTPALIRLNPFFIIDPRKLLYVAEALDIYERVRRHTYICIYFQQNEMDTTCNLS